MRKYMNVDIVSALGVVVEANTKAFKDDLDYDIRILKDAALSPDDENKRRLWLSRMCGTVCIREREAYIKETGENAVWQFYANQKKEDETFKAFAIEITGIEEGRIRGNLHEIDYLKHSAETAREAFDYDKIDLVWEDGTEMCIPYKEFYREWDNMTIEHGSLMYQKHRPKDEPLLDSMLKDIRHHRDKQCSLAVRKETPRQSIKQQLAANRKSFSPARKPHNQKQHRSEKQAPWKYESED